MTTVAISTCRLGRRAFSSASSGAAFCRRALSALMVGALLAALYGFVPVGNPADDDVRATSPNDPWRVAEVVLRHHHPAPRKNHLSVGPNRGKAGAAWHDAPGAAIPVSAILPPPFAAAARAAAPAARSLAGGLPARPYDPQGPPAAA